MNVCLRLKEEGIFFFSPRHKKNKVIFFFSLFFKVHNYREGKYTPLKATKMITCIAVQEVQYLVH